MSAMDSIVFPQKSCAKVLALHVTVSEDRVEEVRLSEFIKRHPSLNTLLTSHPHMRTQKESREPQKELSPRTKSAGSLFLDFTAHRTGTNEFSFFQPPRLWYFVMVA